MNLRRMEEGYHQHSLNIPYIAEDLLEALSSAYEDPGFQRQVHHGPADGRHVGRFGWRWMDFPHDFSMAGGEALS